MTKQKLMNIAANQPHSTFYFSLTDAVGDTRAYLHCDAADHSKADINADTEYFNDAFVEDDDFLYAIGYCDPDLITEDNSAIAVYFFKNFVVALAAD